MHNVPRIHIDQKLSSGIIVPVGQNTGHYLTRVMRATDCLVFNYGAEFSAKIQSDGLGRNITYSLIIGKQTDHKDSSNKITLCFAPVRQARLEEMLNMATQLGVGYLQPVITDHTEKQKINWERIKKIITEASEQSNRNSVPEIMPAANFLEFVKNNKNIIFADERFAYINKSDKKFNAPDNAIILIGPEGGFSAAEFSALDNAGAIGISLGKTILRAETAAIAAITKIIL